VKHAVAPTTPWAEAAAAEVFGSQLPLAERYADVLIGAAVRRGLLGPREAGRIWERHLLNCAVVSTAVPTGAVLYDVGSGAGLPGMAIAIARPDLDVVLIEPLQRRADFLGEAVSSLALPRVRVLRARAEDLDPGRADVVTARAVAPLSRLAGWCLPLLREGGLLLALKGSRAQQEVAAAEAELRRLAATAWTVEQMGLDLLVEPTTVVRVTAGAAHRRPGDSAPPRQSRKGGR